MADEVKTNSNETVIVGCKLPNGLLLTVGDQTIKLAGVARYTLPNPNRNVKTPDVVFADSLTTVPKKFWENWCATHKGYPPLKKGYIYASPNRHEATARAKDTEKQKTGFEPMDPLKEDKKIEPTKEMKKVLENVL